MTDINERFHKLRIEGRKQMTIRLPQELKEKLEEEAEKRGDSLNGTMIRLLYEALRAE